MHQVPRERCAFLNDRCILFSRWGRSPFCHRTVTQRCKIPFFAHFQSAASKLRGRMKNFESEFGRKMLSIKCVFYYSASPRLCRPNARYLLASRLHVIALFTWVLGWKVHGMNGKFGLVPFCASHFSDELRVVRKPSCLLPFNHF